MQWTRASLEKSSTSAVDASFAVTVTTSRVGHAQRSAFALQRESLVPAQCADFAREQEAGLPDCCLLDRVFGPDEVVADRSSGSFGRLLNTTSLLPARV